MIMPGRVWLNFASVLNRKLLIQQRVVDGFPFLAEANTPRCFSDRVRDHCIMHADNGYFMIEQPKVEITIFTPGHCEPLIKSADYFECGFSACTVRCDKSGVGET